MKKIKLTFSLLVLSFVISNTKSHQEYSGNSVLSCDYPKTSPPSPSYLYTCNGLNQSCQSFLIFKSQHKYNSIKNITSLFNTNPFELAQINNVSSSHTFPTNKEVIIPVNCSCSGQYYKAITYNIIDDDATYYSVAVNMYQGLSSCSALIGENPYKPDNLYGGLKLLVPLRCACPTKNMTEDGTQYLMTYSLYENDNLSDLSERFNVSEKKVLNANGFVDPEPVVYPSTTVLIPLPRKPLNSQTLIYHPIQYTPPPNSSPIIPKAKRSRTGLHAGIGAVISVVVLFLIITFCLWLRRKKTKRVVMKKQCILPKDTVNALKIFQVEEIQEATTDFSSDCKIKGSLYKGKIGKNVFAIKQIKRDISQEVNILHKLNHVNLISLHGICTGEEHCYLVYEFMENGSLKDWLKNPNQSGLLKWTQKVQIALDIANGLDYLHNFTYPPYIHKGITSSNVLLNEKLRAKITNFSQARSSDWRKVGSYLTTNVEGTLGYMAPEYLESGLLTPKLDVYAFGVVISELITGKNAINESKGIEELLSESIVSIVEGENADRKLMEFMEPTMRSISPTGLVMEVAKLCVACLARDPERRPSMNQAVSVLTRVQGDTRMWALAYQ